MSKTTNPEKPWYLPAIVAYLAYDCPGVLALPAKHFARDVITLERRVANEGESFLLKTLPQLGQDIDQALQGHIPLTTRAFKRISRRDARPAFLQAMLRRVFRKDGYVKDVPCIESIRMIRQLCFWCKKIEKGFTDEALQKATEDFIQVDAALPATGTITGSGHLAVAKAVINILFRRFPGVDRLLPKHGPGAVSGREGPVAKRIFNKRFVALERLFRPLTWFFSYRDVSESLDLLLDRISCEFGLDRVEFVEKDSKGPRTIGLGPAMYMWCQQALKRYLYDHIEKHPLTRGRVNFTDQTINRELARVWSLWDTLDMSKASDRNSLALVEYLFEGTWLLPWLLACRTPGAVLPDGRLLWYKKFAPMGSAVCFPVQALVYYALAVAVLHLNGGYPLRLALRRVYVYGDDLVLPHGFFEDISKVFESVGLVFNKTKCCVHGKFRESCGLDAYDGHDVTPIRMRRIDVDQTTGRPPEFIPIVEHCNSLMKSGYRTSSASLRQAALSKYASLRKLKLPFVREDVPVLAFLDYKEKPTIPVRIFAGSVSVQGWSVQPETVVTPEDLDRYLLRESLSLGGPIGVLQNTGQKVVRRIALKYQTTLRKRWVTVASGMDGSSEKVKYVKRLNPFSYY